MGHAAGPVVSLCCSFDASRPQLLYSRARTIVALDRWAEVSLLLRKPILQEEDMLYTVAAAEAGLIYTDEVSRPAFDRLLSGAIRIWFAPERRKTAQYALSSLKVVILLLHTVYRYQMNAIAKNLSVLRGALSRWILPYDNNTRIESQCSTPHSVVENMPEEFRGKLTERQVRQLGQWLRSNRTDPCSCKCPRIEYVVLWRYVLRHETPPHVIRSVCLSSCCMFRPIFGSTIV
jgi:hypothetical protein